MSEAEEIARRKGEHLQLAAEGDIETRSSAGWEDVHLVHDALPSIDAEDIDVGAVLLGHTVRLPLVISGMTGGHGRAIAVNELLARVAERTGIAMGVGSQRAALRDPSLAPTYSVVRSSTSGTVDSVPQPEHPPYFFRPLLRPKTSVRFAIPLEYAKKQYELRIPFRYPWNDGAVHAREFLMSNLPGEVLNQVN